MGKLNWIEKSEGLWVAQLAEGMNFTIKSSPEGYQLYLEAPIIDPSNNFHQLFDTMKEARERAEEMFDGLEKLFQ